MTTILGLHSGGVTYMAADSRVLNGGGTRIATTAQKLFRAGEWTIGAAGWKDFLNLCEAKVEQFAEASTIWELSRALRVAVKDAGWIDDRNNGPGPAGFGDLEVLVGSASGLWCLDCAFSYSQIDVGKVWGIGSGWKYAAGAATAFLENGENATSALERSIHIAAGFDTGTDDSVQIVRMGEAEARRQTGICA